MPVRYLTVYQENQGEIIEKKSRFIANVYPAESEEGAARLLEEVRKKYWDARHHCYAYVIGGNREKTRLSDDGEPSGTAGRPILDTLLGRGLTDILLVVTRYFGGTLLGTGGLVRAYTAAAQAGLANSVIIEKIRAFRLYVLTDYTDLGSVQYLAGEKGIPIAYTDYTEKAAMELLVPIEDFAQVQQAVTEVTSGRAKTEKLQEVYYAETENGCQIWDI